MKLIYCKKCKSILNLTRIEKRCACGESSGHYTDNINCIVNGPVILLGISNTSFLNAIGNIPEKGRGKEFTSFVIPDNCISVSKKRNL